MQSENFQLEHVTCQATSMAYTNWLIDVLIFYKKRSIDSYKYGITYEYEGEAVLHSDEREYEDVHSSSHHALTNKRTIVF